MPLRSSYQQEATYTYLQNAEPLQSNVFQSFTGLEAIVPSDCSMSSDENTAELHPPCLSIIVQPNDTHRFRYKSEKGSHGCITGSSGKKTFPIVKLHNFSSYKDVIVKGTLLTVEGIPHVLDLVGKTCKDGVCLEALSADFTAKFSNMRVENKKKDEVVEILSKKRVSELQRQGQRFDKKRIEKEAQEEAKSFNLNSVKICFQAFYKSDPDTALCDKVFSLTINNQKTAISGDLRITRLSLYAGKCTGDDEVILLCEKVKKEDIKIRFFEKDGDWSEFAKFTQSDVHHQYAITFRTPKFGKNEKAVVSVELFRPSDEKCGDSRDFMYLPDENGIAKKRKRTELVHFCEEPNTENIPVQFPSFSINSAEDISIFPPEIHSEHVNLMAAINSDAPIDYNSQLLDNEVYEQLLADLETDTENLLPQWARETQSNAETSDSGLISDGISSEMVAQSLTPHKRIRGPMIHDGGSTMTELRNVFVQLRHMYFQWVEEIKENLFSPDPPKTEHRSLRIESNMEPVSKKDKLDRGIVNRSASAFRTDLQTSGMDVRSLPNIFSKRDDAGNGCLHMLLLGSDYNSRIFDKLLPLAVKYSDINLQNNLKETPLHSAIRKGHLHAVIAMLRFGANPNILNQDGDSCLHLACKENFIQGVQKLLSPCSRSNQSLIIADINAPNYNGLAPVHMAVLNNSRKCLELLLCSNADINNIERKSGHTPLHLAIETQSYLVKVLLSWPEIDMNIEDFRGYTPLHSACDVEELQYEELLAELGDDDEQISKFLLRQYSNQDDGELLLDETVTNLPSSQSDTATNSKDAGHLHDCIINDKTEDFFNQREEHLCAILDYDSKWRKVGECIGIEENELDVIDRLSLRTSPTKVIMKKIKELYGEQIYPIMLELLNSLNMNKEINHFNRHPSSKWNDK